MSKRILLTRGKFAVVDNKDYEWLNQWKWYALKNYNTYYAVRNIGKHPNQYTISMHRQILGLKQGDGKQTDHRNRCGLDNRRCNIRSCNHMQNQQNRNIQKGTSLYKGVCWNKNNKKWAAQIRYKNKLVHLGLFTNELKAAKAYDKKAKELFGEFAYALKKE